MANKSHSRCGKSGGLYPQPDDSYVVGLCTGALSASAICSSRSLTELIPVGLKAVMIAFKTGLLAQRMAELIESRGKEEKPRSWSTVFFGINKEAAEEMIQKFCAERVSIS